MGLRVFLLVAAWLVIQPCLAARVGAPYLPPPMAVDRVSPYIWPNETQPGALREAFKASASGLHLSVGTERALIGLSLNPNATGLVVLDRNLGVIRFHQINTLLLALSESHEDYLALRFTSDPTQWIQRARQLDAESRDFLSNFSNFSWWRDAVATEPKFDKFHFPPGTSTNPHFSGANYLYDKLLFLRLQKFAKDRKIVAFPIDLTERDMVKKFAQMIEQSDHKISVIDLSNAWWPVYIPGEKLQSLLSTLRPHTSPQSTLLLTTGGPVQGWGYIATNFSELGDDNQLRTLGDTLISTFRQKVPRDRVGQVTRISQQDFGHPLWARGGVEVFSVCVGYYSTIAQPKNGPKGLSQ